MSIYHFIVFFLLLAKGSNFSHALRNNDLENKALHSEIYPRQALEMIMTFDIPTEAPLKVEGQNAKETVTVKKEPVTLASDYFFLAWPEFKRKREATSQNFFNDTIPKFDIKNSTFLNSQLELNDENSTQINLYFENVQNLPNKTVSELNETAESEKENIKGNVQTLKDEYTEEPNSTSFQTSTLQINNVSINGEIEENLNEFKQQNDSILSLEPIEENISTPIISFEISTIQINNISQLAEREENVISTGELENHIKKNDSNLMFDMEEENTTLIDIEILTLRTRSVPSKTLIQETFSTIETSTPGKDSTQKDENSLTRTVTIYEKFQEKLSTVTPHAIPTNIVTQINLHHIIFDKEDEDDIFPFENQIDFTIPTQINDKVELSTKFGKEEDSTLKYENSISTTLTNIQEPLPLDVSTEKINLNKLLFEENENVTYKMNFDNATTESDEISINTENSTITTQNSSTNFPFLFSSNFEQKREATTTGGNFFIQSTNEKREDRIKGYEKESVQELQTTEFKSNLLPSFVNSNQNDSTINAWSTGKKRVSEKVEMEMTVSLEINTENMNETRQIKNTTQGIISNFETSKLYSEKTQKSIINYEINKNKVLEFNNTLPTENSPSVTNELLKNVDVNQTSGEGFINYKLEIFDGRQICKQPRELMYVPVTCTELMLGHETYTESMIHRMNLRDAIITISFHTSMSIYDWLLSGLDTRFRNSLLHLITSNLKPIYETAIGKKHLENFTIPDLQQSILHSGTINFVHHVEGSPIKKQCELDVTVIVALNKNPHVFALGKEIQKLVMKNQLWFKEQIGVGIEDTKLVTFPVSNRDHNQGTLVIFLIVTLIALFLLGLNYEKCTLYWKSNKEGNEPEEVALEEGTWRGNFNLNSESDITTIASDQETATVMSRDSHIAEIKNAML